MSSTPNIAIIGAGPAGLSLARFLHLDNIQFTIFERESSPDVRSQGGTLDLHPQSGQKALKEAGLWDEVQPFIRHEGEDLIVVDRTNKRYVEQIGQPADRPELDREVLRNVFLKSIPKERIRWGAHIQAVTERGTVQLVGGEEVSGFDLIVGADGAWSKVRPFVSPATPSYAGLSGVGLQILNVDQDHPAISKLVGNGSLFALGDTHSIIAQRNGDGSIRVYANAQRDENWVKTCGIDFKNPSLARTALADDFVDWAPELKQLILEGSDEITPRALYHLPTDHTWSTRPGFTIIGDAAHLMTPFAGEGANLALIDGYDLAVSIIDSVKSHKDLTECIREFENKMQMRAGKAAVESHSNLVLMHSENAARKLKDLMESYMTGGPPV